MARSPARSRSSRSDVSWGPEWPTLLGAGPHQAGSVAHLRGSEMSEKSSDRESDRQASQAAGAAYSRFFRAVLGDDWVEAEPGIFQRVAREDPPPLRGPAANEEAEWLDERLRKALDALQVDRVMDAEGARIEPGGSDIQGR